MKKYTNVIMVTGEHELWKLKIITGNDLNEVETWTKRAVIVFTRKYLLDTGEVLDAEELNELQENPEQFWKERAMETGVDCMVVRNDRLDVLELK